MALNRRDRSGKLVRGFSADTAFPTRHVSNEEFLPVPQTPHQARVERLIRERRRQAGKDLGMDRRAFLKTTGGLAVALLAMNEVFGRFFNIWEVEAAEPDAFVERRGPTPLIFDVQTHYVSAFYDPGNLESAREGAVTKEALVGLRRRARDLGINPALKGKPVTLEDLSWENFIKEVFLNSETHLALISSPPGPYPWESVVPPKEMTHIRDELNRLTDSRRMLAHGMVMPQLGEIDRDFMELQAEGLHVNAWKCYTGAAPKGKSHGWWMDDESVAYPMLEKAVELGVPRICVHKGLPLGPVAEYNHPRDLIQAAKDFPQVTFLVYHSGFLGIPSAPETFARTGAIPWTTEFCRMKREEPDIRNIYMELGSTFAQLASMHPPMCAHLLGQMLQAFGPDRIVWGTDSIWYGSPAWQIEAFRRFEIPESLQDQYGYPALTWAMKERIFGLNAADIFGIDVSATRRNLPDDYLGRIKMAYQAEGDLGTGRFYGWVAR